MEFKRQFLAETLRRVRQRAGLSLRELSKLSGVSASHILRIESGEYDFQVETFARLTTAMGLPAGLMLDEGIWSPPEFYRSKVEADAVLDRILSKDASKRDRQTVIEFYCTCCSLVTKLCVTANPSALVSRIHWPDAKGALDLWHIFGGIADQLGALNFTDRRAVLLELANAPVETLARRWNIGRELVSVYLLIVKETRQPLQLVCSVLDESV